MIIILPVTILSFLLDGIISNFNLGLPLFTLLSLIIIYPYFRNKDENFLMTCGIIGLMYDFVYTDTLLFNFLMFIMMGICIKFIFYRLSNSLLNISLISIAYIAIYRLISYIILFLAGYMSFNMTLLFKGIYQSLIINIIYVILMYLITHYYSRKYHILKNE